MIDFSAFTFIDILPFIAIGFAAQLVDGALGMAFGVISNTLLVSIGVPPAVASARVHVVECFTTGVSGISHVFHRNVDWQLFTRLIVPGMIGGVSGAYLLSSLSAQTARPFVLAYLSAIGLYLLWRGIRHEHQERQPKIIEPLGFIGGFLDAAGGGGWGPIVTSNLLAQGGSPRKVIGTVNTSEFFLTLIISAAFISTIGLAAFGAATIGLLIGGVVAAPLGAFAARYVRPNPMMIAVGSVLTITSLYGIYKVLA
jgi:hypothetical protein